MVDVGTKLSVVVLGGWIDHEAAAQAGFVGQAGGRGKCQIPTRTVTRQHHLTIIGGQRIEVIDDPFSRRHRIVVRGRERVLRR